MTKYLKRFSSHSEHEDYLNGDPAFPMVSVCSQLDDLKMAEALFYKGLIEGENDLPEFDSNTDYYAGQFVRKSNEGMDYAYRFTTAHPRGPWNGTDVAQTSIFGELKEMYYGDTEILHVSVDSDDGELVVSGISVVISFKDGGNSLQVNTDANGECLFEISRGRSYTVTVQGKTGYVTPPAKTRTANSNSTYIFFTYRNATGGGDGNLHPDRGCLLL